MNKFITEFTRVKKSISEGTTPVYSELRSMKTMLKELLPSLFFQGILLFIATIIISSIDTNETAMIVILLVVNTTTQTIAQALLVFFKHLLRVRKLKKYNLEVNEENIAVLESMEYQSV